MQMMEECCSVAASRFCSTPTLLLYIDDIDFLQPSFVGDRLVIRACVNRSFGTTFEVGCRVEAWSRPHVHPSSLEKTLINRGYLTYVNCATMDLDQIQEILESEGALAPTIIPTTVSDHRRFAKALGRRRVRFARHAIMESCFQKDIPVWSESEAPHLIFGNISSLIELEANHQRHPWFLVQLIDNISFRSTTIHDSTLIRLSMTLSIPDLTLAFILPLLWDAKSRHAWDSLYSSTVIQSIDENNDISHAFFGPSTDMALLRSRREIVPNLHFIIAARSIHHPSIPPSVGRARVVVLPSGWVVKKRLHSEKIQISYVLQLGPKALSLVVDDLIGQSERFISNMKSLRSFISSSLLSTTTSSSH